MSVNFDTCRTDNRLIATITNRRVTSPASSRCQPPDAISPILPSLANAAVHLIVELRMTDKELFALDANTGSQRVRASLGDTAYNGWLVCVFWKRDKQLACVVEDDHGRMFIHDAARISLA